MDWQELKKYQLTVYLTSWCQECSKLTKILDEHGVAYRELDVDQDRDARKDLILKMGHFAIPSVEINDGKIVRGWHHEVSDNWDETIFLKEIDEALSS